MEKTTCVPAFFLSWPKISQMTAIHQNAIIYTNLWSIFFCDLTRVLRPQKVAVWKGNTQNFQEHLGWWNIMIWPDNMNLWLYDMGVNVKKVYNIFIYIYIHLNIHGSDGLGYTWIIYHTWMVWVWETPKFTCFFGMFFAPCTLPQVAAPRSTLGAPKADFLLWDLWVSSFFCWCVPTVGGSMKVRANYW